MENVVFTQLSIPEIRQMFRQEIETYFDAKQYPEQSQQSNEAPELLTVQETARFLSLTVPTIYSKVSKGELPFMKRSKRLYFSRVDLMEYIQAGRKKTNAEISGEVETYLKKRGAK